MLATTPGAAIRRAAFVWQFAAAAALPLWVLVGATVWGGGLRGFVGVALLAPLLVAAQLVLAALFTARAEVRRRRMLGVADTAVLAVLTATVAGLGFFGPGAAWFGVLAVAALLGGYWLGASELVAEVRLRMRRTLAAFGYGAPVAPAPIDAGEYVVVKPAER